LLVKSLLVLLFTVETAPDAGKDTGEEHRKEDIVRMIAANRVVLLHFNWDISDGDR